MAAKKSKPTEDTQTGGAAGETTQAASDTTQPAARRGGKSGGKTTRTTATTTEKAPAARGRATGARGAKQGSDKGSDLRKELRGFAESRPEGWSHDEWTGLLGSLQKRGYDTSDPDRLGLELEKERLALKLEKVPGLGPARVRSLTEHFGTLWSLRHADVDQIASVSTINRPLAERISEAVR